MSQPLLKISHFGGSPQSKVGIAQTFAMSNATKLADHYTDVLALGWRRRKDCLADPTQDFSDLYASDDRLQAALDSLTLLGEVADAHMQALLKEPVHRGELFVLACYALAVQNDGLLDASRALAIAIPELQASLAAALEWAPACSMVETCIESLPISLRLPLVGLRHRDFPGLDERTLSWLRTIEEPVEEDICATFQMIRLLGRSDLSVAALRYLDHAHASVRLAAVRTLLTLAPTQCRPTALKPLAELLASEDANIREEAVHCAVLHDIDGVQSLLASLAQQADATRLYLLALGWAGDIGNVPILIEHLDDGRYRRAAGAALALITGSDPARDGWLGAKPERSDDIDAKSDHIPEHAADDNLPWPDPVAFAAWWRTHHSRFTVNQRYFAGHPLSADWLATVLMTGPLPWRPLAAEHRQRLTHGPLFPTCLPAAAQHALFHKLN